MPLLEQNLQTFWISFALHLWQSTLFIAVLAVVAAATRRSSARLLDALYWTGVLKLLLPLPLLAPISSWVLARVGMIGGVSDVRGAWASVSFFVTPVEIEAVGASTTLFPIFTTLMVIWLSGAVTLLVVRRRAASRGGSATPRRLSDAAPHLSQTIASIGIPRDRLRVGGNGVGPHVRGILKSRIVLPRMVIDELGEEELRAVLIHEWEHVRRRDPLRFFLLAAIESLLWFYLPIWWLTLRIREATEMACDEAVTRAGTPADTYCRSLARTLDLGFTQGGTLSSVGIFGQHRSVLGRRFARIRSGQGAPVSRLQIAALLALSLACVAMSFAPAAPSVAGESDQGASRAMELRDLEGAQISVSRFFQEVRADDVLEAIARDTGLGIEVHGDLSDVLVNLQGPATLVEALERVGAQARLVYHVIDERTLEAHRIYLPGTGGVTVPRLIVGSRVNPHYPDEARRERLMGRVILQAIIDVTGKVKSLEVLNSQPADYEAFGESAMDAVRQWRYEPATRNGLPVPAYFTVQVDFKLE